MPSLELLFGFRVMQPLHFRYHQLVDPEALQSQQMKSDPVIYVEKARFLFNYSLNSITHLIAL